MTQEPQPSRRRGWLATILSYAEGAGRKLAGSAVLSVVSVASGLVPYYAAFRILDAVAGGTADAGLVLRWCLVALVAYALKCAAFGFSTMLSHYAAYDVLADLRLRVADRFLRAPLGEVQRRPIGQIKGVIVDKIEDIEPPLAHMIPEGAGHIITPLVCLAALFALDWRLGLASLATFPAGVALMALTYKISGQNFETYNRSNARMNSAVVEYVEGIEVIKMFGQAGESYEKFARTVTDYRDFVIKWMSATWVSMKLAFVLFPSTLVGVLPVALALAGAGQIGAAEAAPAVMLAMSMVGSLTALEVFSNNLDQLKRTVDELQGFLEMPELPQGTARADVHGSDVRLRGVRFSYTDDGPEVLHGIDLELPQGGYTALVGPSGGGKSTVAKLVARFWDPDSGSVEIGGCDVRQMPLAQVGELVSFVTQDNFLFRTSILENIRLGRPDATDEEVYAAARAARCDEFVQRMPQGYLTPAGEAGKRLSGGERQRIAIARMMLKDAPIVVLDEATAFTDPENEHAIQQAISRLAQGKTLLVVAHRLSTVRGADAIVVLDDGRIVTRGTHDELLASCGLYRSMWEAHVGVRTWAEDVDAAQGEVAHV